MTDTSRPRPQITTLDPRQWRLATQMTLATGILVSIILALLAWVVARSAEAAIVQEAGETLRAEASGLNNVVLLYFREKVGQTQVLARSVVIRSEIETQNAGYSGTTDYILAEIRALDRSWPTAPADDPLIVRVTVPGTNPAAEKLVDFLAGFPDHSEIFITDRYGGTAAATGRLTDYYQADEAWWQEAWNGGIGATYLSQPTYDESAGLTAVLVAVPVTNQAGQLIGVLRSTLAVDELFSLVAMAASGHSDDVILVDASGQVIFDSALQGDPPNPPSPSPGFMPALAQADAGLDVTDDIHGRRSIFGYAALEQDSSQTQGSYEEQLAAAVNDLGWTTVVYQQRDILLRPVADFQRLMAWVTAASVLSFALVSFGLSRSITSPLRDLAAAAQRLSAGDVGHVISIRGSRELALLTESFNHKSRQVRTTLEN
ncbi:MAG: cache domain-containing protein, partial [Chloroflexota bacterium]